MSKYLRWSAVLATQHAKAMYNLTKFTLDDMYDCAIALRNMDAGSQSMEETANRIVRYLYTHLIDWQDDQSACALVRFFKTHPYDELDPSLQLAAREIIGGAVKPSTKCLTLLATAGDQPEWNSRYTSSGHKAIPLVSKEFVQQAPMIFQLIHQFGLDVEAVLDPAPEILLDLEQTTFNVFYVADALASPFIPAQEAFVIPHQIRSVLGFGGILPSGNLFAMILFTKVKLSRQTADLFRWIAAYVRIAVAAFDQEATFASRSSSMLVRPSA